jgi:LuxR family maltose regulon positive regulatory protein
MSSGSGGPAARGAVVSRRGLLARLGEAARVTQISAPPGSGKTFLLRSWIGEADLADNAAWVSVHGADRGPQRFWVSVADALRGTAAGAALMRPLTVAPGLDGWAIVERLLKDLAPLADRVWLIIDDLHELASADAQRQLELLVLRAPPELRFVLATRYDLRLGLHRLRLEGDLTEIRTADLRFTLDEAQALFQGAGVALSGAALALLHERTEGWAAGLRLAALSLAGHPDPERFAAEFSGSERTVAGYLLAEVLERQSEPVRLLLLRTSVLDRVNGPLVNVLTRDTGGERTLQDLEDAGAFVMSLDARRSWFRYHRLFADLLQLELRRTAPDEITGLHHAASGWFARHGDPVQAIRHAQAAQDWPLATRLLADHSLGLSLDGQGGTVHELLAGFRADTVVADAELAAQLAVDQVLRGSLEAAERYLALAAGNSGSVPADRRGRFQLELATLRMALAEGRGDLPAAVKEAQPLLAAEAGGEDLRAVALTRLGTAELWALRADDAERHLEQAVTFARRIERPWLEVRAMAHWAWTANFQSAALAIERGTQAIELAELHGWIDEPVVAVAYLTLGVLRTWQLRLEEAETLLDRAERTLRVEIEPAAGLMLRQARGTLERARGRNTEALIAFQAVERAARLLVTAHPYPVPARAHMLQTLVRLGQVERAEHTLAKLDEQQRERGEMRVAAATLRLAKNDPQAATNLLAPLLNRSVPMGNIAWMCQAFVLEAIARDALGDQAASARAFGDALELAEPDGVLLPFALTPAPQLLKRHARQRTAHAALISEILNVLAGQGGYGGTGSPPVRREGLGRIVVPRQTVSTDPITDSEIRVLRYLPTNLSMPEIAAEVSLSVNTVRTHARHLYEKLGAHGRTEAVEHARALGLLAPSARQALSLTERWCLFHPSSRAAPRPASRGRFGRCCHSALVLCAVGGQPLVEPDGLVSVGTARGVQRDGQIDIGGARGAQVRKARAGELGAELRVLGGGDVLRGQRVRTGDEAAILRRAGAGAAEHADEHRGDHCDGADGDAARAGR